MFNSGSELFIGIRIRCTSLKQLFGLHFNDEKVMTGDILENSLKSTISAFRAGQWVPVPYMMI